MKFSLFCGVAALELLSHAHARFLVDGESRDGTLLLGFSHKRVNEHPIPGSYDNRLRKRAAGTLESPLENMFTYYNIEVELGTPGQQFNLLIDTGSSDLWVIDGTNPYCATSKDQLSRGRIDCSDSGTFAKTSSSTFNVNNTDFFIKYGDGTVAQGDWATDTLTIQNQTIPNMSFGLGLQSNSSIGVLGIGYDTNEATLALNPPYSYANLPIRLVQENIINTPAYSLWLNDVNADEGSLLFGGVDHAKYSGDLLKVPILKNSKTASKPTSFLIAMTSVKFTSGSSSQQMLDTPYEALLDSGTSLSYFPQKVASTIFQAFDANYEPNVGFYVTTCDVTGSLDYSFSGAAISVKFDQLLLPLTNRRGGAVTFNNGKAACAVGILPSNYPFALLGDTFLRSAYVVYDLQNHEIALAQGIFNATDSNVEVISNTIPGASQASAYSSTSGLVLQTANPGSIGGMHTQISTDSNGNTLTITITNSRSNSGRSTATAKGTSSSSSAAAAPLAAVSFPSQLPSSTALLIGPLLIMLVTSAIVLF